MMDIWNTETFDQELIYSLRKNDSLISNYWIEENRRMNAYIECNRSAPLQSNNLTTAYNSIVENILRPLVAGTPIRIWHYTRLLDHEANSMSEKIHLSTRETLRARLVDLQSRHIFTQTEVEVLFNQSPFQTQNDTRSNRLYATTCPYPSTYIRIKSFLKRWGGESAHFHLQDIDLMEKLENIGLPRIVEIELLTEGLNAYRVASSVARVWGRRCGQQTEPINFDYSTKDPDVEMRVIRIHSKGDNLFSKIGTSYPISCHLLIDD